jgi:hypothetical protein
MGMKTMSRGDRGPGILLGHSLVGEPRGYRLIHGGIAGRHSSQYANMPIGG